MFGLWHRFYAREGLHPRMWSGSVWGGQTVRGVYGTTMEEGRWYQFEYHPTSFDSTPAGTIRWDHGGIVLSNVPPRSVPSLRIIQWPNVIDGIDQTSTFSGNAKDIYRSILTTVYMCDGVAICRRRLSIPMSSYP